jgi:hypothetical protein
MACTALALPTSWLNLLISEMFGLVHRAWPDYIVFGSFENTIAALFCPVSKPGRAG